MASTFYLAMPSETLLHRYRLRDAVTGRRFTSWLMTENEALKCDPQAERLDCTRFVPRDYRGDGYRGSGHHLPEKDDPRV